MSTFTLSVASAGSGDWGDIALVFSGSPGPGASASGTGTGAPSLTFTTTGDHSAIAAIVLDANAVSGTSRTWLAVNGTTPTAGNGLELGYTLVSGTYGIYTAYWPDAGLAGAKTVGLSAPAGMAYTIIATEVLGTTPAPPNAAALPVTFTLAARPAWTDAGATLAAGISVSSSSVDYRLLSAELDAGISLTAGANIGVSTVLPAVTGMIAVTAGWIYTGQVPLTYLQYLQPPLAGRTGTILDEAGGAILDEAGNAILDEAGVTLPSGAILTAVPGQFFPAIGVASGWPYSLTVPPADGRWVAVGGGVHPSAALAPLRRGPAPLRRVHARHGDVSMSAYQAAGAARSRR